MLNSDSETVHTVWFRGGRLSPRRLKRTVNPPTKNHRLASRGVPSGAVSFANESVQPLGVLRPFHDAQVLIHGQIGKRLRGALGIGPRDGQCIDVRRRTKTNLLLQA